MAIMSSRSISRVSQQINETQQPSAETPWGADAGVIFNSDIYDQVVVAAFGGVSINLHAHDSKESEDAKRKVHPLFLLILAVMLFVLQVSTLIFLRLELDDPVVKKDNENNLLLPAKLLMVTVLQIMLFKELIGSLKMMMFVANPTSWIDIHRLDPWKFRVPLLYFPFVLAPMSFLSVAFKFTVCYIVCVDSVSMILQCRNVKDAIFNSLAITFVVDLDDKVWEVAQDLFHLTQTDTDWRFRYWNESKPKESFLLKCCLQLFDGPLKCLHRKKGGRHVELLVTAIAMFSIYLRQIFVVLYALQTNRLPVARDICSMWRWESGSASNFPLVAQFLELLMQHTLIADIRPHLNELQGSVLNGCPSDGEFGRMQFSDARKMFFENVFLIMTLMVMIFCAIILPSATRFLLNDRNCCTKILQEERKSYERWDEDSDVETGNLLSRAYSDT